MSTNTSRRGTRPLALIHLVAVLALAVWWGAFFWRHSPLRHAISAPARPPGRATPARPLGQMAAGVDRKLAAIANALESAVGDLAFGGAVLVLIAVGTGVYVRRFEIWLEARSSGEAVALGSTDLSDAALAANEQANRFLK